MPIARLLFAALVLAMAAGQAFSYQVFVAAVGSYRLPLVPAPVTAAVLFAGGLLAGAGLLMRRPSVRWPAGRLGLGVAVLWAALGVQAFARGLDIPNCGCFGRYLAQELSWRVLLQDGYFVLLAFLAYRSARSEGVA
ncbi:MAG: MauE/DoxX family redox-associated membrane protein [Actinomycetota bacterium]